MTKERISELEDRAVEKKPNDQQRENKLRKKKGTEPQGPVRECKMSSIHNVWTWKNGEEKKCHAEKNIQRNKN